MISSFSNSRPMAGEDAEPEVNTSTPAKRRKNEKPADHLATPMRKTKTAIESNLATHARTSKMGAPAMIPPVHIQYTISKRSCTSNS